MIFLKDRLEKEKKKKGGLDIGILLIQDPEKRDETLTVAGMSVTFGQDRKKKGTKGPVGAVYRTRHKCGEGERTQFTFCIRAISGGAHGTLPITIPRGKRILGHSG